MSTEQNKAVVRRFIEGALTTGNTELADELLAPNYVNHMVPGGREAFKQFVPMLMSAYPDLKITYSVDQLIAEGDYVVARQTYHMTNGDKEASGSQLSEYRVVNGKIVEDWPPDGSEALLAKLGVTMPSG